MVQDTFLQRDGCLRWLARRRRDERDLLAFGLLRGTGGRCPMLARCRPFLRLRWENLRLHLLCSVGIYAWMAMSLASLPFPLPIVRDDLQAGG